MAAFINHFTFEFRTGLRNKTLLLMNYLLPLGFYLFMGFVMTGINPDFLLNLAPAMVIFAILAATFLGVPDPLVNARENGIFRSYKINGIPSLSILVIPALTTLMHLTIVAAIIAVTAGLFFDAPLPENWFTFALVFLAGAFSCAGISVLIGVISANSRITVLWSQVMFLPSILLSGMMFPYQMLPNVARIVAQFIPATHAMNAFNGFAMQKGADFSPWLSVLVLVLSGFMAFGLSIFLFSWDSRNTTRRGHPALALLVLLPNFLGLLLNNPSADLENVVLQPVAQVGSPVQLSGEILDASKEEVHTLTITWADGSEPAVFTYSEGVITFNESHVFELPGTYVVTLELMDDEYGSDLDYQTVTVAP